MIVVSPPSQIIPQKEDNYHDSFCFVIFFCSVIFMLSDFVFALVYFLNQIYSAEREDKKNIHNKSLLFPQLLFHFLFFMVLGTSTNFSTAEMNFPDFNMCFLRNI